MGTKLNSSNGCGCSSPTMSRRHFLIAGASSVGLMGCMQWPGGRVSSDAYAEAVKSHESLRGYWRFENDLVDLISGKSAVASGVNSFDDGAVKGSGIKLAPGKNLAVSDTKNLFGRFATIELFFKVNAKPSGTEDSVIIAQADGDNVRYIIGVKNDLSALLYRNTKEEVVTRIDLPTNRPVEVGRWYHLAVTSFDLDVRAYVDGYECSLFGGAYEFTRAGPKTSVMTFGNTTAEGWSASNISLDEVAIYDAGLTPKEFQKHLRAGGLAQQLAETGVLVSRVKAMRDANRDKKAANIIKDPALKAPGKTRVYEGEYLSAINFTVGGIGAGAIQFDGNAVPKIWQIACNHVERTIDDTFLAIRIKAKNAPPVVKALQTKANGQFSPMSDVKFEGEYPLGKYRFEDNSLPVDVALEVFNPFIPMDLQNSSIPCAIYQVTVKNTSTDEVTTSVLSSQKNALGYTEGEKGEFGSNQNTLLKKGNTTLLHMTRTGSHPKADMVLLTQAADATGTANWTSPAEFKREFTDNGGLTGPNNSPISPAGQTVNGALSAPLTLAPGESKSVTFVLTWYFTETKHGAANKSTKGKQWVGAGQMYNNWWSDAMDVASYLDEHLVNLSERTRRFHDTLYASTLPVWLLDRCSSQLAVLRSQTCWWSQDGYFGAWEGCNPENGCCAANCTHVWHYAQAHARLLPELGRIMRKQDYDMQLADGLIPYRHSNTKSAADGHFGTILNTYREHQCSADDSWLKSQWPRVKKAVEWGINEWDPNRIGFMSNTQHNTLDGNITGCSSWIGSLYLTSLEAAARMADIVGEPQTAKEYRAIRESGKKLQNKRLWNGEYYIQEEGKERFQDYLDGCHIDQLLGEWWADQLNIDRNYPRERAQQAMSALLKYNFRADFYGQSLKPRQYCEIEDGGMKMITWPRGQQPIPGMKYGDEVMTGFEYGAAVTMMQNGMIDEGLMLLKVVADRYDGRLRTEGVSNVVNGPWGYSGNPYGDDECGKYYGRSLSVWSALTALQGFIYDGPAGLIGFRPILQPENHASFFSVAQGYGLFEQTQSNNALTAVIAMREGSVHLSEVVLGVKAAPKKISAKYAGAVVDVKHAYQKGEVTIQLARSLSIKADENLEIHIAYS